MLQWTGKTAERLEATLFPHCWPRGVEKGELAMTKRASRLLLWRLIFKNTCSILTSIESQAIHKSKQLFSSSFLRYTIIMVVINFTIQFGYYGLWLWFPELFNKLNLYYSANPNATVSVCEVIDLQVWKLLSLNTRLILTQHFVRFSSNLKNTLG